MFTSEPFIQCNLCLQKLGYSTNHSLNRIIIKIFKIRKKKKTTTTIDFRLEIVHQ